MNKIKEEFNGIFEYFKKKPLRLSVPIISVLILVILTIFINIIVGIILFVILNLIWIIPYIKIRNKKQKVGEKIPTENEEKIEMESSDSMVKKTRKVKKTKDKTKKRKIGKIILLVFLIMFIIVVFAFISFFIYIAVSAGKFDPDKLYTKEASTLYDSEGNQFAKLGTEMRTKIKYDKLSEELVDAIVATEDSRFFQHNGFDLPRFMKASVGQVLGQNAGGASTLTMQVSKNQFTSTTSQGFAGIKRKFTDIYMSIFQIEKKYSKEEIMEFYVNSYYLGSGAYGVEQASKTYFNKSAKDLNVSESAMIAGMFQSPVSYDPNLYPENTEKRRLIVLKLMKRHGYITDEEYEIAKKMTVDQIVIKGNSAKSNNSEYQTFVDTVAADVKEKTGYDPYSYSMKIYTTMDRSKQDSINKIMSGKSYKWENDKVDAGITVLDTKTGAIVAVGGSRVNKGAKSFNNATMTKRQIGSTAKPLFDYGPAIEYLNWNTSHPILDNNYSYSDGTEINNWDGRYKGMITIRQALVESRNIPALKTFQSVKNSDVKDFVTKLGLSPEVASNGKLHEAHSIGGYNGESPLTVAAAYAAFGNDGTYTEPYSFTKVEFDKDGDTYTLDPKTTKAMSKETAYMVTDMLVDTGQNALGKYNNINGSQFAAKTGTTNFDEKTKKIRGLSDTAVNDLWVAGYNANYAIAVWYGYDNLNDGTNRFGSSQNSRLFQAVAKNFFKSDVTFKKPDSVVEVTVERNTGTPLLPSGGTPNEMKTTELFKESSKPTEVSSRYNRLNDVTDAKASVNGRKATITWKGIGTPQALSRDYWSPLVNKAFAISSDQQTYLGYIMGFNNKALGSVVYNVYLKTDSGLQKVTTATGESALVNLPRNASPTYVVKASYSNYGGCESNGVEVKVDYKGTSSSDISVTLADGNNSVETTADKGYVDSSKPIKATIDGEDVTSEVNVSTTYTVDGGSSTKYTAGQKLTEPGTYIFTYTVTYEGVTVDTLTRTVVIA